MLNKLTVTQQLLDQLDTNERTSLDQAMQNWWVNLRAHGGLRLTMAGMVVFDELSITKYEFEIPTDTPVTPKLLLTLDQKLTCPYYITPGKKSKLWLYGGKEAVMLNIYGDIKKFIDSLSQH